MEEREYLGSLLMVSPEGAPAEKALPRDEHGFPYQVILLLHPGGGGGLATLRVPTAAEKPGGSEQVQMGVPFAGSAQSG